MIDPAVQDVMKLYLEHVGLPRLEDFCWIATQESNVYGDLAASIAGDLATVTSIIDSPAIDLPAAQAAATAVRFVGLRRSMGRWARVQHCRSDHRRSSGAHR